MGFSVTHLFLLLIIVLLIWGPSRLPGLGKGVGEAIKGFKKAIKDDAIDVTPRRINAAEDDLNSTREKSKSENEKV